MSIFLNHTATHETYTLSLHDALPICTESWMCSSMVCARRMRIPKLSTSPRSTPQVLSPPARAPRAAVEAGSLPSSERSEEHTSELQSRENLVCRLLLEKQKTK